MMTMTSILRIGAAALLGLASSSLAATVTLDLTPCILAPSTISQDNADTPDAYLISTFYKGYWGATQLTPSATTGTLDLTNTDTYGKCNVVYVGVTVTEAQKLQLQEYSKTFKVRIVYFNAAETANDPEVNSRLGISQDFSEPLVSAPFISLATDGASVARVVPSTLTTDPRELNIFTRPVFNTGLASSGNGTTSTLAEYVDDSGTNVPSSLSFSSVAAMAYTSTDGYEELHIFFSMAWFDLGSWGWAHFFVEWGTKGIFQARIHQTNKQRRFYLAGMVDDLFLATGVFEYDGDTNEGAEQRLTATDMSAFASFESSLNSQYGSSIVTEWPFNGLGILEVVDSAYVLDIADADIALLPKGEQVGGTGIASQLPEGWLASATPGMTAEFDGGAWSADGLLGWVISNLGTFWWQSHTLSHLARDDLGESDCSIEDGGNAQIAVLTGMFASDNYNWRSLTSPGITGHFNKYCLASATANLMECAPGDNTYDGVQTDVSLVSSVSEFHSIYTTESTNGFSGFQIVPRYATFVYFNCVTGDCLVNENEWIRRVVCGCSNLNPAEDKGTCSECDDIQSFGSIDALYETEAATTTRQILMGRRDKYMFHQANVIQNSAISGGSLLARWYQDVMAKLSEFIAFPVTSNKFDDHCAEFTLHEDLDGSGAVLTATLDNVSGSISGVSLSASGTAGLIPFTVPSSETVPTTGLTVGSTVTYGSDTTYYLATSSADIPTPASAPDASSLAPIGTVVATDEPVADEAAAVAATEASATTGGGDAATPVVDTDAPVGGTSPPVDDVAADAPTTPTTAPVDVASPTPAS
ncbi:unnamed protein product [Scytosiphon promiscuus]